MTQWSIKQAFFCLIGSSCLTLTASIGGYRLWINHQQKRLSNEAYQITSIVQTGPEKEALKTGYLAELLELSTDRPTSLYALDLKKAKVQLLASPLIARTYLKRLPPSTLYVDYEVRHPIAWLADYQNTAVDEEGYLFPVAPFFSPKELPEIYLGLPPFGAPEDSFGRRGGLWQSPLQNRYFNLALEILHFWEKSSQKGEIWLKRIDVSNAFAKSLGQKEVVLFTDEELLISCHGGEVSCAFPKILRLNPKNFSSQLSNFFSLRRTMVEDYRKQLSVAPEGGRRLPRIIDLRIPQLAFVENR